MELHLPADAIAPALARAGLRTLTADLSDEAAANVTLLTTELVSNAVRHGTPDPADEILVRASLDGAIRVEVLDGAPSVAAPGPAPSSDPAPGGMGLFIVDTVARSWGVARDGNREMVWFELDCAA